MNIVINRTKEGVLFITRLKSAVTGATLKDIVLYAYWHRFIFIPRLNFNIMIR